VLLNTRSARSASSPERGGPTSRSADDLAAALAAWRARARADGSRSATRRFASDALRACSRARPRGLRALQLFAPRWASIRSPSSRQARSRRRSRGLGPRQEQVTAAGSARFGTRQGLRAISLPHDGSSSTLDALAPLRHRQSPTAPRDVLSRGACADDSIPVRVAEGSRSSCTRAPRLGYRQGRLPSDAPTRGLEALAARPPPGRPSAHPAALGSRRGRRGGAGSSPSVADGGCVRRRGLARPQPDRQPRGSRRSRARRMQRLSQCSLPHNGSMDVRHGLRAELRVTEPK